MKTSMSEMKITPNGINSSLDISEENVSELETWQQNYTKSRRRKNENYEHSTSKLCGDFKPLNVPLIGVPKEGV